MRARWVLHNPSPELPLVGYTIVASFLPWRFHLVMTFKQNLSHPLSKLTKSFELGVADNDAPPCTDLFMTTLFRCNRDGLSKSLENPLFEQEYSDLSQAQKGHNEIVDLLSKGKLKLSRRGNMDTELLSKVESGDDTIMVLTKIRYLLFFHVPRSSVMPFKVTEFVVGHKFQVQYNTSDLEVLNEWHQLLCSMVSNGMFKFLSDSVRVGYFPYPEDKKHLAEYVKRFV